jgi:peptidyl-prolyl cis-trans isomerase C
MAQRRMTRLTGRKAQILAALAALGLTLGACGRTPAGQGPPEPGDRAVARVNGDTIWASDVKREAVAEGVIGPGDPLDSSSDLFRQVLDEVVDTKVLAQAALAQHLDRDALAQRRLAAARERALEDILVDSVVGRAVTPQAEDALYRDFLKHRTPTDEVHLRQIVVASEADAQAVKKALTDGGAFEALAMARSIDPETRFKGGDLGEAPLDMLPQPLAEAVKSAKPGQVVGPVKLEAGWAVLKLDDRRPETPPSLESVRPQLIHFITYDRVKDLVMTLRSRAKIISLLPPPTEAPQAPTEPASAPPANAAATNGAIP